MHRCIPDARFWGFFIAAAAAAVFAFLSPDGELSAQGVLSPDPARYGLVLDISGNGLGRAVTEDVGMIFGKELKRRVRFERKRVLIPDYYGELIHMESVHAPEGRTWVLWYQDKHGVLRNAIVPQALGAAQLLMLERKTTQDVDPYRRR